jgi:nitrogen regulatory protein P-II 1
MKQITAIIQPQRLEAVEQALYRLRHLPGFTLMPARGHARGHGPLHLFTADEWNPDWHPHIVLLMYCPDDLMQEAFEAIQTSAYTGNSGDGLIAVSAIEDVVRIRTGERGDAAL